MRKLTITLSSLFLAAATLGGCNVGEKKSTGSRSGAATSTASGGAVAIDDAARKEAGEIFASRCAVCHGPTGEGNGPASAGLTPKPRNFTDATWQGSVTDEHIEKIVQYGGASVGKSPAMPPNPDLTSKPAVVAALREHVRSLKK